MFRASVLLLLIAAVSFHLEITSAVHQPVVQEKPHPTTSPPPTQSPHPHRDCPPGVEQDAGMGGSPSGSGENSGLSSTKNNCTEDTGVHIRPSNSNLWKTHVIMACTVTAAIEIVIVIVIFQNWRQLRWTLRKMSCPCDERPRRDQHQVIDSSDAESGTEDVDPSLGVTDLESGGHGEEQPVAGPSTSRDYSHNIDTSQV